MSLATSTRLGFVTIDSFPWLQYVKGTVDDQGLCSGRGCPTCWLSLESVSVHTDCLLAFKYCETYYNGKPHRLWRFCQARRPHPNMPFVDLPVLGVHISPEFLEKLPKDFLSAPAPGETPSSDKGPKFSGGLTLAKLPQEILRMIHECEPSTPLWSTLAGWQLSRDLSTLPQRTPESGQSTPLTDIASWERGEHSVVRRNLKGKGKAQSGDGKGPAPWHAIRLVVDSHGIKRVENVPDEQEYERHDDVAFITMPESEILGEWSAIIEDGRMTLHHPDKKRARGSTRFWITDFKFPACYLRPDMSNDEGSRINFLRKEDMPSSGLSTVHDESLQLFNHCKSVNLDPKILTGLTFLYGFDSYGLAQLYCELTDIHGHTVKSTAPNPATVQNSLRTGVSRWIYVPIAPGDEITDLCIASKLRAQPNNLPGRPAPSVFIRMKLAGDILVGCRDDRPPYHPPGVVPHPEALLSSEFSTFSQHPTILFYHKPEMGPVTRLRAEPRRSQSFANPRFHRHTWPFDVLKYPNVLFSDATLQHVERAAVYRRWIANPGEARRYYCTGILFTYKNGGQRAVGECRVGVDNHLVYEKPSEIVYAPFKEDLAMWNPPTARFRGQLGEVNCMRVAFGTAKEKEGEKMEEAALEEKEIRGLPNFREKPMNCRVAFWTSDFDTFISFADDIGIPEGGV
ncbi:hypothetical protein QBC39DRAFT_133524 [Podospora conica]|nr:hypothetical protein QBC39DRAFT_133524 [Schizothecium conicum]